MYKNNLYIFFIIAFLIFPAIGITGVAEQCIDKKVPSDYNISVCIFKEHAVVDKKLNLSYAKLMKLLQPEGQDTLRQAQRAWMKFRDNECHFLSYKEHGATFFRVIYASCYLKMTKKRLSKLDQYVKDYSKYSDFD